MIYSNHQNSWQKLGGTKGAWPRCRPWRASARLRPPPRPVRFVLPSFFVMNCKACFILHTEIGKVKGNGAGPGSGPAPRLRRPAPLGAFRTSLLPRVEAAGISLPPQRANSRYLLLGGGVPPRFWRWAAKIFRVIFSWSASVSSRNWQPYSVLAPSFSMTRST